MKLSIYIFTTIGLLFSGSLKAQFPTNNLPQGGSSSGFPTGNQQAGFPQGRQPDKIKKNPSGRIGLDDSTKVVYGPTSTKYFLEEDVFNNRKKLYNIDTIVDATHNYNFVQRNKNLYQDLGNLGTAIRPVFYKAPEQIGTMLGYDAFSLYTFKPSQVRYFNTKSPFSNIIYVPGGGEQDLLQFELSRNVDSLWNVGINVQRITANKQLIDKTAIADNSAISHWDFMVHSNYQTKNKKYSVLAYFNLSDHNSNDQGGVVIETGRDFQSMLFLAGNRPLLTVAATRDKSYNLHIYHEYVGYKAFQIYQVIDYQTRKVQFKDNSFAAGLENGFYPKDYKNLSFRQYRLYTQGGDKLSPSTKIDPTYYYINPQSDSVYNETRYTLFEHKSGIKGFYKGFNYRLHIRQRFYTYQNPFNSYQNFPVLKYKDIPINSPFETQVYKYTKDTAKVYGSTENMVGIWLNQYFKDSTRAFAEAEYFIGNDYQFKFEYQGKWLNLGYRSQSTSPTLVQRANFNNGLRWEDYSSFLNYSRSRGISDKVQTNNIYGYGSVRFGGLIFHPSVDFDIITNYIYFDTLAFVRQNKGTAIGILRTGLGFDYRKGKFSMTNQIYYSESTGPDLIRFPKIFANSRLAFDLLYKKKLYIQTGIELHYKSGYYADAYMPAIQQFHLQDKQNIEGYLQADVFADLRINRVRLFFKFAHVNQGIFNGGYYASPGFAGMGRVLAFGVHWLLFD
ncbi:MAG: hypothetical protein H7339_00905 [Arcicella sp.]|nr:hypothetical protein [Arcicella sp.]